MSRRGRISYAGQGLEERLAALADGRRVQVMACDATSDVETGALVRTARASGLGVDHVAHASGVLRDALMANQTSRHIADVMAPKGVAGARIGNAASADVISGMLLFSSVSALVASPGQVAYAAGNCLLDAQSMHRSQSGVRSTAVQWPAISGVGMAAAVDHFVDGGTIDSNGVALVVGASVLAVLPVVTIFPSQTSKLQAFGAPWVLGMDRPGASLAPSTQAPKKNRSVRERSFAPPNRQAQKQDPGADHARLRRIVIDTVIDIAGAEEQHDASVVLHTPFMDLDIDSLAATELSSALAMQFDVSLPPTLVFDHPTPDAVVGCLATELAMDLSTADDASEPISHVMPPSLIVFDPPAETLEEMLTNELANVSDFCVWKPNVGRVRWRGSVDLRGLDMQNCVSITDKKISLHDDRLNAPAHVTFWQVWAKSKTSPKRTKYEAKLKAKTEANGAEFVSYNAVQGKWEFMVSHFSTLDWAESDSSSESDIPEPCLDLAKPSSSPVESPLIPSSKVLAALDELSFPIAYVIGGLGFNAQMCERKVKSCLEACPRARKFVDISTSQWEDGNSLPDDIYFVDPFIAYISLLVLSGRQPDAALRDTACCAGQSAGLLVGVSISASDSWIKLQDISRAMRLASLKADTCLSDAWGVNDASKLRPTQTIYGESSPTLAVRGLGRAEMAALVANVSTTEVELGLVNSNHDFVLVGNPLKLLQLAEMIGLIEDATAQFLPAVCPSHYSILEKHAAQAFCQILPDMTVHPELLVPVVGGETNNPVGALDWTVFMANYMYRPVDWHATGEMIASQHGSPTLIDLGPGGGAGVARFWISDFDNVRYAVIAGGVVATKSFRRVRAEKPPLMKNTFEAAEPQLEEVVLRICMHLLENETLSAQDNLFDMGMHSLEAMQLASRLSVKLSTKITLATILGGPTVAQITVSCRRKGEDPKGPARILALPASVRKHSPMQLSYNQEQMLVLQESEPSSPAYNEPVYQHVAESFPGMVQTSVDSIIKRHEILTTVIATEFTGVAMQRVLANWRCKVKEVNTDDSSGHPNRELSTPFDLKAGPAVRASFISAQHLLLLNMHHAVTDGHTIWNILPADMAASTTNKPLPPPPHIQYLDFAVHQRQWL
ncbi:MAG: KR domain-containing protein, partial [Pontimonas sp.]